MPGGPYELGRVVPAGDRRPTRSSARGLRPVRVLRFALLAMGIGHLGRAPILLHTAELPVMLNDLFVGAVLVFAALACLQARRLRLDSVVAAAGLFASIGFGAALWSAQKYGLTANELVGSLAYLARWLAYAAIYVSVINVARDDDAELLWQAVERMVLAVAAFGVVQVFALPGFAQLVYPSGPNNIVWDVQGRRLVSTLLDPNFAGILMLLPLLIQLAQLAFGIRVALWKPLLLLAAILMTVSRGTIAALVVGAAMIVAVRGVSRRMLSGAAVAALVAVPFVPAFVAFAASFNKFSIDASALDRVTSWLRALTVIADNPLFGVGFNTYGYVQRAYGWEIVGLQSYTLDGGLLFITVLTGIVGLLVYATMLGLIIARCRRLWRDVGAPPRARAFALGTAAATVCLVLHSVTVNSLLVPFTMEPHWVLVGIVFLHTRARAREVAAERLSAATVVPATWSTRGGAAPHRVGAAVA